MCVLKGTPWLLSVYLAAVFLMFGSEVYILCCCFRTRSDMFSVLFSSYVQHPTRVIHKPRVVKFATEMDQHSLALVSLAIR